MNRNRTGGIAAFKRSLQAGAALALCAPAAMLCTAAPAAAQQAAPAPIEEENRYTMRLMLQTFDGAREFSHTQAAGFARKRKGDESWVMVNFGDGAVVIDQPGRKKIGNFKNSSAAEAGMRYDYRTKTLAGNSAVAQHHNRFVRPMLGHGPALGADAKWRTSLTLAQLGLSSPAEQHVTIELSRRYFRHGGRDYVLLHYRVPSFTWTGTSGRTVVQWGEGIALTDPGFGQMYWNAALHRAVGQEGGSSGRPYRYAKTMVAVDAKGKPMLDPRDIPEVAAYVDHFYGASNKEVMGFVGEGYADQAPLQLSNLIDVMALSMAEDSANQLGEVTSAYTGGPRGAETVQPLPKPAEEFANGGETPGSFGTEPELETLPHDMPHVLQGHGADAPAAPGAQGQPNAGEQPAAGPSAGGGGGGAGGGGGQSGGGGGGGVTAQNVADAVGPTAETVTDATTGGANTADQVADTLAGLTELTLRAEEVHDDLLIARREYEAAVQTLGNMPQSEAVTTTMKQSTLALKAELTAMNRELAQFEEVFFSAERTSVKPHPSLITEYIALKGKAMDASAKLQGLYASGEAWDVRVSDKAKSLHGIIVAKASTIKNLESSLEVLGGRAYTFAKRMKALDPGQYARVMRKILESPYAEKLGKFADFLNKLDIAKAVYNTGSVFAGNTGGELPLSRDYGEGSAKWLGLELASLWGNIASGNVPGFFLDAATTLTTSLSDILIANYGLTKTFQAMDDAEWTRIRLETDQRIQRIDRAVEELEEELAETKEELENFDEEAEERRRMAEELLEERRRNREEAERQAEAERQRLIAEARAENERIYQENLKRPPTPEEWAKFNADIAAAMKPDYPTAPPPTPEQVAERLARAAAKRMAEAMEAARLAAEEIARIAAEEAERQRRAEEAARASEEAVAKREQEAEERRRRNEEAAARELEVSEFEIEPVEFDPPEWDPPVWDPPEWVPPEWDPPEPTEIEWTDFDDDDFPNTGNLAYDFENMSGVVETDLSRWAEWLATQNVRELTRLALNAGYPNLASALADAENIIHYSQDEGYRRWAMQAPSCGGYVGCGPSYLERWAMKSSIVALGDILAQSREIFSTGGFTDIGISGLNLRYLLRDHSLEDGDIVQIRIRQFNRLIYEGRVSLTNAGENFNLQLGRGVASLEIYAENEGYSSPNTAQIRVDNVVRGEGTQTYSLNTGQTATLRIESQSGGRP